MSKFRQKSLVDPKDRNLNVFLFVNGIIANSIFLTLPNCTSHCTILNRVVYVSPIDFIPQAPFYERQLTFFWNSGRRRYRFLEAETELLKLSVPIWAKNEHIAQDSLIILCKNKNTITPWCSFCVFYIYISIYSRQLWFDFLAIFRKRSPNSSLISFGLVYFLIWSLDCFVKSRER